VGKNGFEAGGHTGAGSAKKARRKRVLGLLKRSNEKKKKNIEEAMRQHTLGGRSRAFCVG